MTQTRITRDDLEAKLREVEHGAESPVGAVKSGARVAAVAVVLVVVVGAYLVGRRRGRRRNRTVVEVHRL